MKSRYSVLTILFVAWIASWINRIAMSVALPYISADLRLSSLESGIVLSAFVGGYSLSQIPGGVLADLFGVRRVATAAMVWWSMFTALTGAASNLTHMLVTRFVFGLGEGIFPACAFKTIAVWFPRRERATANAFMLASNPLGAALSPLVVVAIMSVWGWRSVFFALFLPGIIIAVLFWLFVPNRPEEAKRISTSEVAEIEEDSSEAQVSVSKGRLGRALTQPRVLKYFLVLFAFDVAFWGFTAWLPTYLVQERGFSMMQMGAAASLPFFTGTVGCFVGGWLSDRYFSNRRRLLIILTEVISAAFLCLTFTATSVITLVICQTLAGFFLLAFYSAFWALPMNSVPKELMGITSGTINMAGQLAAFIAPMLIGYLIQTTSGDFTVVAMLLIGSILVSAAIVLTIPREGQGSAAPAVMKA